MSLPEAPEGLSWSIASINHNTIAVALRFNDPEFPEVVAREELHVALTESDARIQLLVEGSAKRLINRWDREVHLDELVQEMTA